MENEQLITRIRGGADVAENMLRLYEQNRGIIARTAKKYQAYAEIEDLMQEGYIGLSEAVSHFDIDRGVPFINYAAFWIRQSMRRYIDNCCGAVRLPSYAMEWIYKYNKVIREYQKHYGGYPPDPYIRHLLGVSQEELQKIRKNVRAVQVHSLSESVNSEDDDLVLEDVLASDYDTETESIAKADKEAMARELWIAVEQLPGNLPEVVKKSYIDGWTLKEIGQNLGVGTARAGQMRSQALRALGKPGTAKRYRGYYEEYLSAACFRRVSVESFQRTWTSEVELEVLGWCT